MSRKSLQFSLHPLKCDRCQKHRRLTAHPVFKNTQWCAECLVAAVAEAARLEQERADRDQQKQGR